MSNAALKVTNEHTPMMQQYLNLLAEAKQRHEKCVLLFRLGDFYEIFYEDAKTVASVLGIQLTRRSKQQGNDIPMCGIPWHQLDSYLPQLIKAGYPVAIAEQTETPDEAKERAKKQGKPISKVLVERNIYRIVTAGTLYEDNLLIPTQNNYLCAIAHFKNDYALAWMDISTGTFYTQSLKEADIAARLTAITPKELLIADRLRDNAKLFEVWQRWKGILSIQPSTVFHPETTQQRLLETFGVKTLEAFGNFNTAEIIAAGSLLNYAQLTQQKTVSSLTPPQQILANHYLQLDAATRRSLELMQTQSGDTKNSFFATINKTVTAAGSRLLANHLAWPLANQQAIEHRLGAIDYWQHQPEQTNKIREILKQLPDMERALSRLAIQRGGPRDLAVIYDCLCLTEQLAIPVNQTSESIPKAILALKLPTFLAITQTLERALREELPLYARDGNFIRAGFKPELDNLKEKIANSQYQLDRLQQDYRQATGIQNLKIKSNNVLGYFIEVPTRHADEMMQHNPFIHRQTLANCARFSTQDLVALQSILTRGEEQVLALELEIFSGLVAKVLADIVQLRETASKLALLDVYTAWAHLALNQHYCKPVFSKLPVFEVEAGRHPVVENMANQAFMANDCSLQTQDRLWLLTGPNMAGKSTFLRQNALMVIMAHMGGYVPATSLTLGVVDKLFSRVGAADDLAHGRSTFMVEMVETAAILNQSTENSFVILDEIGRGTATYDGLSIAWAVLEYLHNNSGCRGLFATHYHELTQLSDSLKALSCHTMQIAEENEEVIFLHTVIPGIAERSYGIFVAQLAGMPKNVLKRAKSVLHGLETKQPAKAIPALPLLEQVAMNENIRAEKPSPALELLNSVDPDSLSPREALQILYNLKSKV